MKLRSLLPVALIAGFSWSAMADMAPLQPGMPIPTFMGNSRLYAVTREAGYANASFRAEVTVTVRSGNGANGIAFFGMGKGAADPAQYNEPVVAPSLALRMCPSDFAGGQANVTLNKEPVSDTANLGDGTHRIRLSWDAVRKFAWLEIQPNWKPGSTFAPKLMFPVPVAGVDFGTEGHLFAGGSGGVRFEDLQVSPLSPRELAKLPATDSFPKDPSAGTWLPAEGASSLPKGDSSVAPVDGFLNDLRASLRPLVCWYHGASLAAARPLSDGLLELPRSKWTSTLDARPVAGEPDARDLTLTVALTQGEALSAGIAAALDFKDWSKENYVLIPASVYNGNRNRIVNRGYGEGLAPEDYHRKDLPLTHGSVPCLSKDDGTLSRLDVSACNAATPAVCIFDKKARRGFILLAEQAGRAVGGDFLRRANGEILDNAFAVEENLARTTATVVVSAPGVRAKKPEFIGFSVSPDRGISLRTGDKVSLKLRLYDFAAADIPAVLDKFMAVRKAETGLNHPRNLLPASESLKMMTARIDNRFLATPTASFYCPENGPWIAFGWIGGWMNTFPMLALDDDKHLERVTRTFDWGMKAQRPSGYFWYSIFADGKCERFPFHVEWNLARTNGDVLYWMIKQFQMLEAQGHGNAVKPEWKAAMKRLVDAAVTTWKKDGQWGKMLDVETGEVVEYNSTGGIMLVSGLALAADYYKDPAYLTVAEEAANYYYNRDFVKQGQTTGACADILQNADSETAFAFTTALMSLYDVTGDPVWLEKSRNLANLAATWTVSYDYELPKFTALGALGEKLAGAVWASTQNKHAAPGYCTGSGDALFKIYRAIGDTRYANLLRDIMRAHDEAFDGGGGTERLTYCDADSRGENPGGSNGWTECNGAMMAVETPGIYLRTDADRFFVFDAVDARIVSRGPAAVQIEIHNPTKFDASVAIFAENARQAQSPLGAVAYVKWPKVEVNAGQVKTVQVFASGEVR